MVDYPWTCLIVTCFSRGFENSLKLLWWTIPELVLLSHVVHVHMKVSGVVCIHTAQTLEPKHAILKLQLHDAIYRLRFYSNSLIHILSLSNLHNNVASLQKNRADKSHRVIVAILLY